MDQREAGRGRMKPYYEADGITIYHGDCLEVLPSVAADVMVADPPFGMGYKSGWSGRSIAGDNSTAVRDAALVVWGERPALLFGRWDCQRPTGVRMLLTWDKGDWPGMGDLLLPWGPSTEEIYVLGSGFVGKRGGSVIRCDRLVGATLHPNEKPVPLLERLLCHCPEGVVVDPFMGVGTTLVAAKQLGRRAIGIEIEERYCEIAARRLSQRVFDFRGGA